MVLIITINTNNNAKNRRGRSCRRALSAFPWRHSAGVIFSILTRRRKVGFISTEMFTGPSSNRFKFEDTGT